SSIPILDTLTNNNSIDNYFSAGVTDYEDLNCSGNSFKTNSLEIKTKLAVEIFPNPVYGMLTVKSMDLARIERLEIISIDGGHRNYPFIKGGDKITTDLSNLISGIYTLVFIDSENQFISRTKLIKE
ncbi:MAG: T9SS type A sorting domain-containing protein, partial [Chitinophagales bacterium]|nr:T9SS type A sorting domain-containing protein [Chitinophagales bacterium]